MVRSLQLGLEDLDEFTFYFKVDYSVTQKKFAFAAKRKVTVSRMDGILQMTLMLSHEQLPLYFCSASDGTNVVKVFSEAIEQAVEFQKQPSDDFLDQVQETLEYFANKQRPNAEDSTKPDVSKLSS